MNLTHTTVGPRSRQEEERIHHTRTVIASCVFFFSFSSLFFFLFLFRRQDRCEARCWTSLRLVNYITEMCLDNTSKTMTGVIEFHTHSLDCTIAMAHWKHAASTLAHQCPPNRCPRSASHQPLCSDSPSISDFFHLVFKCLQLEK